jgi:hypothetical protein
MKRTSRAQVTIGPSAPPSILVVEMSGEGSPGGEGLRPIEAEETTETIVGKATLLAVLTRSVPLSAVGPRLLLAGWCEADLLGLRPSYGSR